MSKKESYLTDPGAISGKMIAIIVAVVIIVAAAAVGAYYLTRPSTSSSSQEEVVIYADYSANVAQPFFNNFTKDTGIKVIPVYGAMGTLVGKLVASKSSPQADVLFGGAPSAYIGAAQQGVLQPYEPNALKNYPAYLSDTSLYASNWTWYSFTYNILGIVVNTNLINQSMYPTSWWNLTNPEYKGKIVIENPSTSTTTGLGFFSLIYQIYVQKYGMASGTTYFKQYVSALLNNTVAPIAPDDEHAETIVGEGTGGITIDWINGPVLYKNLDGYPLIPIMVNQNILGPTAMGIVKGAPHMAAAEAFINWVLSQQGQSLLPTIFLKPAIMPYNITPPPYFPSLQQEEQYAFPYNQTWTVENAQNIDSIFNQYSGEVSS